MKEKAQDKKTAVLEATLELISEQGFHGTPMSQIAEKANVGMGTIYRYFSSKEDMINALYIDVKTRLAQYALKGYSESMPVRECFLLLLRNITEFFIENPAELFFIEQYSNSPLITNVTREEGFRMFAQAHNIFKRASEENLMKELPIEIISTLAYGATLSLVKFWLSDKENINKTDLDAGIAAIWDAVKR
jgi:AcrR family transcriptional regulator